VPRVENALFLSNVKKLFSFPARYRIKNNNDFATVFHHAKTKKIVTRYFVLHYAENLVNCPKIGVIASKKNFPLAVTRNRLKRIARESFRLNRSKIKNLAIILSFFKLSQETDSKQLRVALSECWDKFSKPLI
jgi:ribonuclease P protein component